jgi:hypothetical protein
MTYTKNGNILGLIWGLVGLIPLPKEITLGAILLL